MRVSFPLRGSRVSLLAWRDAPAPVSVPLQPMTACAGLTYPPQPGSAGAQQGSAHVAPSALDRLQGRSSASINAKAPLAVFAALSGSQQQHAISPATSTASSYASSIPAQQGLTNGSSFGRSPEALRRLPSRAGRAGQRVGSRDAVDSVTEREGEREGTLALPASSGQPSEFEVSDSDLSDYSIVKKKEDIRPRPAQKAVEQADALDGDDKDDQMSSLEATLQLSLDQSPVWKEVEPLMKRSWLTAYLTAKKSEQRAFLQLISLPKRGDIDESWIDGVRRSNQRSYKVGMTIIVHVVGIRGLCSACKTRTPVKQGGCTVLPPEANGMRDLQDVIGVQCTNCYFFPTSKACEFSSGDATPAVKQTPIPIPRPAPAPITKRSTSHPLQSKVGSATQALQAPLRHPAIVSTLAQEKAVARPISQTPVPVPAIPNGPSSLLPSSAPSTAPDEAADMSILQHDDNTMHQSRRVPEQAVEATNGDVHRSDHGLAESGVGVKAVGVSSLDPANTEISTATSHSLGQSGAIRRRAESPARSDPSVTTASIRGPNSTSIVGKALSLIGEISQLPSQEQSSVYQKISEILEIARRPVTNGDISSDYSAPLAAADDWEIAPGRLSLAISTRGSVRAPPVAFSTAFLRREVVSFQQAQKISRSQKILNKHIPALGVVRLEEPEDGWECSLSVLEGTVRVRMPGVEGKIGQGGVVIVTRGSECIVTNILHQESKVQIRWGQDE